MRGRGVVSGAIMTQGWWLASVLSLTLLLAWPVMGAGARGGDHRAAMSLAVQVEASTAYVVAGSLEGRPLAGGNFDGRPHS